LAPFSTKFLDVPEGLSPLRLVHASRRVLCFGRAQKLQGYCRADVLHVLQTCRWESFARANSFPEPMDGYDTAGSTTLI
jgi:hypothetical protein